MIQLPMTPEQYAALSAQAAAEGVTVVGNEGIIQKMGVTARFIYDGTHFTLNVTDKPFFVTEDYVETEIRKQMGLVA